MGEPVDEPENEFTDGPEASRSLLRSVAGRVRPFWIRHVWIWFSAGDGILLIPLAALLASAPRFLRGPSCGHDFDFHLVSWLETQRSWREGVFYPHWAATPNWGAGEARFIFYPPLTWMLGAALGYLVSWNWAAAALTFLCLAAGGFATRALARTFLPGPQATLAGVLATATPYALFTAYERTAFGELAAAAMMPLLLLFALRQSREENRFSSTFDGSAALLAVVLAAIWLANAPAGVMATYTLAFAALAAALILRAWWPIARAAAGAVLGLGIAAFYLVPAAWEQRWVAIEQAVDVGMRIGDSWLFARHPGPDLVLHDQVLRTASVILACTVAAAAIGFGICFRRGKLPRTDRHERSGRHIWITLALLVPVLFALQFPVSAGVWNLLPKLQFLQFPWRWLAVLGVPCAIFAAAATPLEGRRARRWAAFCWTASLLVLVAIATLAFHQNCDEEDNAANQLSVFQAGTGVDGTDEYTPVGADNSEVASGLPDGCLVSDATEELGEGDPGSTPVWYDELGSCDDTYDADVWKDDDHLLQIDADHSGFVVLRLRRYPAWVVTINGKLVDEFGGRPSSGLSVPLREDGLIVVPVAAGPSTIEVRWTTTPDVRWGRWISLGALVLLALVGMLEWRMRTARKRGATEVRLSS